MVAVLPWKNGDLSVESNEDGEDLKESDDKSVHVVCVDVLAVLCVFIV